jgi:hypothetical protein
MQYEPYTEMEVMPDLSLFRFVSAGPAGLITKEIRFAGLPDSGMYSVHLGDIRQNGDFDPSAVSNTGDRNRVLATVILAIELYTERYPGRSILIGGFDRQRARLFRLAIGVNFKKISQVFTILEVCEGRYLPFSPDTNSTIFHLRRRKLPDRKIQVIPASLPVNEHKKADNDLLKQKDDIFALCDKGLASRPIP